MSFSLFSNGDKINYGIKNYIADDNEDLKNIPRSTPGSMIYVIKTNKYYILNNQFQWVEQNNNSDSEDSSSIDEDQINALINAKIAQVPTLPDPTGSSNQVLMTQGGAWTVSNIPEGQIITIDETLSSLNNGHAISNKAVTTAVNAINNAGYQTAADVQNIVTEELSNITSFEYYLCKIGEYSLETGIPIAEDLDEAPDTQHIYLVPTDGDNLNMYAYIDETFVFLGTTEVNLENYIQREDLADVATSGSYEDLDDTPDIPMDTADLTNGAGFITKPQTTYFSVTPDWSEALPGGHISGVQTAYMYYKEITPEEALSLQALNNVTSAIYLNNTDTVLTEPDAETPAGDVCLAFNIKPTETGAESGYDAEDTSKPIYVINMAQTEDSSTGYLFIIIASEPLDNGVQRVFTQGDYLTAHQSLAEYTKTNGFNSVAFSGNYNDLSNLPINSNGSTTKSLTLSKPLTVTGGDSSSAGKIILNQSGNGQITDSSTSTIFGFINSSDLTVGSSSYALKLRGSGSRPTFNGNNLALQSDITAHPSSLPVSGKNTSNNDTSYTINVSTTAPSVNNTSIITIVVPSS